MIAGQDELVRIGRLKLKEAMEMADFGSKYERRGIERVGLLLVNSFKGSLGLERYKAILSGKSVSDLRREDRPDHWERIAADIASALVCIVIYDNYNVNYKKSGVHLPQLVTIADFVLNYLISVGAVKSVDGEYFIEVRPFASVVLSLERRWHPHLDTNTIYVNGKSIAVDLNDVFTWYGGKPASESSSGLKGFISGFLKKDDSESVSYHPGVREWLSDIRQVIRDGNESEAREIFKCLLDGLLFLSSVHEVDDSFAASVVSSADDGHVAVMDQPKPDLLQKEPLVRDTVKPERRDVKQEQKYEPVNPLPKPGVAERNLHMGDRTAVRIPNRYVVVSRNLDGELRVKETDNFYVACAMQMAMLAGTDVKVCMSLVKDKPEDLKTVFKNLLEDGRDRVANDEEEVYIFLLRGRNGFR